MAYQNSMYACLFTDSDHFKHSAINGIETGFDEIER